MTLFSQRFNRRIRVTRHAASRMTERHIDTGTLVEVVETGQVRYSDVVRLWVAKDIEGRVDNMICVAAVLEDAIVVKTVMHHFDWR